MALRLIYETREEELRQHIIATQKRKLIDARERKGRIGMPHKEWRKWIEGLKVDAVCMDCGQNWPPVALGFDHVPERGAKSFSISASASKSHEAIKAEIAKCDIVCHSCHAIRTNDRIKAKKLV